MPHFSMNQMTPALKSQPERLTFVALTVVALLALAGLGLEGPRILASFHDTPDEITNSTPLSHRDIPSKMMDRLSKESLDSNPNPSVQKAVLYEEDQDDRAGKPYGGTVVWRTDSAPLRPGLVPQLAVRADIDIPEQQMRVQLWLRSNDDKALTASHTVDLIFIPPKDFAHGGIASVHGLLMKDSESTQGIPITGIGVKVAPNFFMINLSPVETHLQRNVELLKERSWFDIPVVYDDGGRAILAIEKGASGERTFFEAFAAWEQ